MSHTFELYVTENPEDKDACSRAAKDAEKRFGAHAKLLQASQDAITFSVETAMKTAELFAIAQAIQEENSCVTGFGFWQ